MYRVLNAIKKIKCTCVETCTHIAYSLLYIAYAIVCQCIASFLMNPFKCSRKMQMYRKIKIPQIPRAVVYITKFGQISQKSARVKNETRFFRQEIAAKQYAAATRFEKFNTFSSKIVDVPVADCEIAVCDVADFSFENTGPGLSGFGQRNCISNLN